MKTGIELIAAERERQVGVEGWTSAHDDKHDRGELSLAGACYRLADGPADGMPTIWPWDAKWWKPKIKHRNLIRAGALFKADLERIERRSDKVRYADTLIELDRRIEDCADEIDRLQGGSLSHPSQGEKTEEKKS